MTYQYEPTSLRLAVELAHPHREAVRHVHAALLAWLTDGFAERGFDRDAFQAGLYDVGAGLAVFAESGRCPNDTLVHRWRVRDIHEDRAGPAGLTVVLRTHEPGLAWLLIESSGAGTTPSRHGSRCDCAASGLHQLLAAVVGRAQVRDGLARVTAAPCPLVADDDAAELAEALRDPRRRLPLLVFTDPVSRRRSEFACHVAELAEAVAGAASMYTLMPRAAAHFRQLTGFNVVRACGDDAVLVYLAHEPDASGSRRGQAAFAVAAVPDGELLLGHSDASRLHLDTGAADKALADEGGRFTAHDLHAEARRARFPQELTGIPTLLDTSKEGAANLDDITVVRQLLREADARALRAEARADELAASLTRLHSGRLHPSTVPPSPTRPE